MAWRTPASASRWTDLPAGDFAALSGLLPQARFAPVQAMLARLREIKTPGKIDILRRLSRIADRAITEAYRAVHVGSSEMDLAAALTRGIYEQGAEYFKLMIVATGERSCLSQCRSHRPRAQAGRRVPRRDISDHRRLSRRRLPHRRRGRAAASRRTDLGEPDRRANICCWTRSSRARRAARFTSSISPRSASSDCRRFPSSATASVCICTRIPTSARPTTARSRPAWCSASSR